MYDFYGRVSVNGRVGLILPEGQMLVKKGLVLKRLSSYLVEWFSLSAG